MRNDKKMKGSYEGIYTRTGAVIMVLDIHPLSSQSNNCQEGEGAIDDRWISLPPILGLDYGHGP